MQQACADNRLKKKDWTAFYLKRKPSKHITFSVITVQITFTDSRVLARSRF